MTLYVQPASGGGMLDPATLLSAGSKVLGSGGLSGGLSANGGAAGPSHADSGSSANVESIFNTSGWSVNFGNDSKVTASGSADSLLKAVPWYVWVIGGVVVWKLAKK